MARPRRALTKFRPRKRILMGVFDTFYVFSVVYAFCFWACVWLMAFLWPISNFSLYLCIAFVIPMVRNQFRV
ncbi:hypothetical protein Hanom_Chr06g00567181 [Helianthus anomalus]